MLAFHILSPFFSTCSWHFPTKYSSCLRILRTALAVLLDLEKQMKFAQMFGEQQTFPKFRHQTGTLWAFQNQNDRSIEINIPSSSTASACSKHPKQKQNRRQCQLAHEEQLTVSQTVKHIDTGWREFLIHIDSQRIIEYFSSQDDQINALLLCPFWNKVYLYLLFSLGRCSHFSQHAFRYLQQMRLSITFSVMKTTVHLALDGELAGFA